jgi:alkylation response protein AidB-like acyl-CoA dehydrogenase
MQLNSVRIALGEMHTDISARIWRDARVQRIYGGANEVVTDIIGRAVVGQ